MNYHCLKEWIRNDLTSSCYITGPGTSKSFLNNFASRHHFSTNILVSWCLPLSHIFTQNFLKFSHPPPPQAWYTVKPVFQGPHIRGRGWLKAQKRALLELFDDFKHKLKLSKVKHTSQDLCLDFWRFLPCHIREFLCQKWRQALTNKFKKRWRSNRSSWSLIMLLCVQFKNTRESAFPLRRHIGFFLGPSLIWRVRLTREIIQYSFRVSRVHSTRA